MPRPPRVCMADKLFDARGLKCPMPVLRAVRLLRGMAAGDTLTLLADDLAAKKDVPDFCAEAGYRLLAAYETENGAMEFRIQKE